MRLEGVHHITCITADARRNVDFYVRVLGLRMVKKTVNHDAPDVYHLYYADEPGSPGSVMTFFEFPGATPGRDGAGAVHRIVWRVASAGSLDFWAERLAGEGLEVERGDSTLRFRDPEGLGLELAIDDSGDPPLKAISPEVPPEHALLGFAGVRAYAADPEASARLLGDGLAFEPDGEGAWRLGGEERHAFYAYDPAPPERTVQGAGSLHHVAWASRHEDHAEWKRRAADAGARPTEIIERHYFRSIYFREPSGVLFEIATLGPGFTVDEPLESLGESLVLPPWLEERRESIEAVLTPVENPRQARSL